MDCTYRRISTTIKKYISYGYGPTHSAVGKAGNRVLESRVGARRIFTLTRPGSFEGFTGFLSNFESFEISVLTWRTFASNASMASRKHSYSELIEDFECGIFDKSPAEVINNCGVV